LCWKDCWWCGQGGLLLVAAGDNTFRVLPPLNITETEIQIFMEKLSAGAASYQMPQAA